MDKKKLIQIAIVIAAFGGSGLVLYNGFFKQAPIEQAIVTGVQGEATASTGPILPYGRDLNFSNLSNGRFQFDAVRFSTVSTSTEIDVPLSSLLQAQAPLQP